MKALRVGLIGESIATVTQELTAKIVGSGGLDVYSTPSMIALMESAAVSAIDPYLATGEASVGIEIHVQHVRATPIGEHVTAMAEITKVDGKRIIMEVRAWDERTLIGEGKHTRYIIDIDEFMGRVRGEEVQ